LLLPLAFLAGCATQRGVELAEIPDWEARKALLSETTRWEISGRIGVSAGDEGFNGKLWWWQREDYFRANISGPLGVGTVRIEGEGQRITVTDNGGEAVELQDAESDLRLRYGWTIPVTSLRFWALGIPDPAIPAETVIGEEGLLRKLEQSGWTVTFSEYREGGGQQMPRRFTADADNARVKLVIDNWIFY
jgi:outer membrane lipoprotein LolB